MNLQEEKLYIKTMALNMIYKFVIGKFVIWNCLESQNYVLIS